MTYQLPPLVRDVVASLVPVICPPDLLELGLADAIVDHVGLTIGALPPPFRHGLRLGLTTYDVTSIAWLPGRGRRAHALPPELAERWFARWEHGITPIERELARAVGQLLKLAAYEQPAVQERLGYTPAAWIEQVNRRRLQVYSDDVRRAEVAVIVPDPLRPRVQKKECA